MRTLKDETGETLVELMVTILIMAIGVTAVAAALTMTIQGSDAHHSMSQGEVMVRDYGEAIKAKAIQAAEYTACPDEVGADGEKGTADDLTPTNFDTTVAGKGDAWTAAITSVEYWVPAGTGSDTSFTFTTQAACEAQYDECVDLLGTGGFTPACDPGYQRVTYLVQNARTDYADMDITGRVLTRRNDSAAPAA